MSTSPRIAAEANGANGAAEDNYSGPLAALKALGIATCIVGTGALASIFTIRAIMGVDTVEEFANAMRTNVQKIAPALLSRIYRQTPADETPISILSGSSAANSLDSIPIPEVDDREGTWEERLSKAFNEGGLEAWMEAAGKELERDVSIERNRKRNGTQPRPDT